MKLTNIEKAAIEWAKQRRKFQRAESLGKASARAALCRRADELSKLAFELDLKRQSRQEGKP